MAKEVNTPLNFLMVMTGNFDNLKKNSCLPNNLLSHFRSFFWDEYEQFNNHIKETCETRLENISSYHPHKTMNFNFFK